MIIICIIIIIIIIVVVAAAASTTDSVIMIILRSPLLTLKDWWLQPAKGREKGKLTSEKLAVVRCDDGDERMMIDELAVIYSTSGDSTHKQTQVNILTVSTCTHQS